MVPMRAPLPLLALLWACEAPPDAGPEENGAPTSPSEARWTGTEWAGDYVDGGDVMFWVPHEAVFRIGRPLPTPEGKEGAETLYLPRGRADVPLERVLSPDVFRSAPARPEDLRKGRRCLLPDTVYRSPGHMVANRVPPPDFARHAAEEAWHEVPINNTSELPRGVIEAILDGKSHALPVWALRVRLGP